MTSASVRPEPPESCVRRFGSGCLPSRSLHSKRQTTYVCICLTRASTRLLPGNVCQGQVAYPAEHHVRVMTSRSNGCRLVSTYQAALAPKQGKSISGSGRGPGGKDSDRAPDWPTILSDHVRGVIPNILIVPCSDMFQRDDRLDCRTSRDSNGMLGH